MIQPQHLFVYGTLRSQYSNQYAQELRAAGEFVEIGKVQGRVYQLEGYPGLLLSDQQNEWVEGEVYRLASDGIFPILDEYEGCGPESPEPHEYRRTVVPVLLKSGEWIEAAVYIYMWNVEGRVQIVR